MLDVICTVRNASDTLPLVLESVVDQSFEDWKMYVVDDGSDDGTLDVLKEYARRDLRICVTATPGVGRASALQIAFGQGTAPFVANVDGDDPCHRRRFELQIKAHQESPGYACIGTEVVLLRGAAAVPEWKELASAHAVDDVSARLPYFNSIFHCTAMMRRAAVELVAGYDQSRARAIDYDLWVRLLENGYRLGVLGLPLVGKRTHEGQSFERSDRWSTFLAAAGIQIRAIRAGENGLKPWLALAGRLLGTALPSDLRKRIRLMVSRLNA